MYRHSLGGSFLASYNWRHGHHLSSLLSQDGKAAPISFVSTRSFPLLIFRLGGRQVGAMLGGAICAVSLGDPVSRKTSSVLYSPSPPCSRLSDRCRRNGGISSASGLTQPQQTFQSVFLLCSKPFSWRTNCAIPHELGLVGRERGSKLLFGAVAGEKNSAAAWLK